MRTEDDDLVFPELIFLNDYKGDFQLYFNNVYLVFKQDFILSQPLYKNLKVSVQKYPEVDRIHRTFLSYNTPRRR